MSPDANSAVTALLNNLANFIATEAWRLARFKKQMLISTNDVFDALDVTMPPTSRSAKEARTAVANLQSLPEAKRRAFYAQFRRAKLPPDSAVGSAFPHEAAMGAGGAIQEKKRKSDQLRTDDIAPNPDTGRVESPTAGSRRQTFAHQALDIQAAESPPRTQAIPLSNASHF